MGIGHNQTTANGIERMSDRFEEFSNGVHAQFNKMSEGELYVVNPLGIYESYLAAFPTGTNPIYRERAEHDCSCCKNFIRNLGKVVSITNGVMESVWDVNDLPYPYDVVAAHMANLVRQQPIVGVYRSKFPTYGNASTIELTPSGTKRWNHFHGRVSPAHLSNSPDEVAGKINTTQQVFKRGLDEISVYAIETVNDLLDANSLYRGEEYKETFREFKKLFESYHACGNKELFSWQYVGHRGARFRSTVVGTLLDDLSEGRDLEAAVGSYEAKVAPANFKRSSALITPRMVEDAEKTLAELGLSGAIHRRYARISDVSVNNVLFVDNSVREQMKDGLMGLLADSTSIKPVSASKASLVSVGQFVKDILPKATKVRAMVENRHLPNFASLTAPRDGDTGRLFKWGNDFAWSYDGEVADSIKERVKKAGGNVQAKMRVSLAWFNYDDLDIHAWEPNGNYINFRNKRGQMPRSNSGTLDVDMNAGAGKTREAVENIFWNGTLTDGNYTIGVHNFSKRESIDIGFTLEVECDGVISHYTHKNAVADHAMVKSIMLQVKDGKLINVDILSKAVTGGASSVEKWGVATHQFVDVDSVVLSPNHWNESDGNKHWFFILKGCRNPDETRGMYNEFLRPELHQHRKVFEVLAGKVKCPYSDDQLSGIGFSSTKAETLTVQVETKNGKQVYEIDFTKQEVLV